MITARPNVRRWTAAMHRGTFAASAARRRAAMDMAGDAAQVAHAQAMLHRDTNRYVRGLAQSASVVRSLQQPELAPSRFYEQVTKKLQRQLRLLQKDEQLMREAGRTNEAYFRKLQRRIAAAQRELARVDEYSLSFNLFGKGKENRLTTVRNKVYGGVGRVLDTPTATLVEMSNLEPHATLVEWRFGFWRNAVAMVKSGSGGTLRRFSRKYAREVASAMGS